MDVPRRALPADLTQRAVVSIYPLPIPSHPIPALEVFNRPIQVECIIITLMQIILNLERRLYFWSTSALNLRVWRDP